MNASKYRPRPGGVDRQLRTEYFVKWARPYFKTEDLEEIVKHHGDQGAQLAVVNRVFELAQLPENFMDEIYNDSKLEFIKRIEPMIIDEHPDFAAKRQRQDLGIREEPVEVKEKRKGIVEQRSVKGKVYTRKYSKWTAKETDFVRFRITEYKEGKLSLDGLKKDLSTVSGNERSSGSIKRKISRMKE